jgi:hypothetical protein
VDLNYLDHRRGVSLMLAKAAKSSSARIVHEKLADAYAQRVADARPLAKRQGYWTRFDVCRSSPRETRSNCSAVAVSSLSA